LILSRIKKDHQGKMFLPEIILRHPRTQENVPQKYQFKRQLYQPFPEKR